MTSELRECLIGYRGCLPEGDVPPSALSLCFGTGTDPTRADTDGDGLDNCEEYLNETDPSGNDADGDGVPDGYDSDGDGADDGTEVANGSDPNDPLDFGLPPTAEECRVLMTQSLGNMVACEALKEELHVNQYFMFNAAVATECFDGSLQNADEAVRNKYVPPQWRTYNTRAWSANWYSWFTGDADDARSRMGWVDRFAAALNNADAVFNYYSTGDEVFHETPNPPWLLAGMSESGANYCWQKQETLKGTRLPAGTLSGGWGFHRWRTAGFDYEYTVADADRMVADGSITSNSVFDRGYTPMFSPNATEDEVFMVLAKYVPAVSSPVGGCAVLSSDENEGDLNDSRYRSGWVGDTSRGNDWKHSDMKDVAYFYVWPLYNELVNEKGNFK